MSISPMALGAASAIAAGAATTIFNVAADPKMDWSVLPVALPVTAATGGVVMLGVARHPNWLARGGRGFQVMAGAILGSIAAHGVFELGRASR